MTEPVRLWRCSTCQKWSHAKKRPSSHQRWARKGDLGFDPSKAEPPLYDSYGYMQQPEGHHTTCGPFEPWYALPGDPPPMARRGGMIYTAAGWCAPNGVTVDPRSEETDTDE